MGFWGLGSEENDHTMDFVDDALGDDKHFEELSGEGRELKKASRNAIWSEIAKHAADDRDCAGVVPVGVVIWCVKQGAKVPMESLRAALADLQSHDDSFMYFEPEDRKKQRRNRHRGGVGR
mmetsp:Transcript_251/g.920  ORF Transcript_251/g.920 Transcript_251/m.920 type:complete len:121 (+) Transcript_251:120-482(+)